nr:linear amide C-N hydrolase [Bacteroidales bacterium]
MKEFTGFKIEKNWASEVVEHKNFRDLGNYVIELPDFTDASALERSLVVLNALGEIGGIPKFGCTAMAKRNSKGEVVMGRNMDLDISQKPAYVFRTTFGKYKNVCVSYSPGQYLDYAELQKKDEIEPEMMDRFVCAPSDALNEKGLYIQVDLREELENTHCYGLHTSRGEVTRADGTPWKDLRASTIAIVQMVSQNCATVKEAIEYLNNSYDWYTFTAAPGLNMGVGQNNMACMIGDATGEFGLIEFAQDEFCYMPYQFGHANFYINPKWNALDPVGAGLGRLAMVSKVIGPVETLDEAMDAMKPIMWRNETLWLGESKRADDGKHLHPYNQIIFQDDKGNPQMDWRSEYVTLCPVLDDGRMIVTAQMYEDAGKSSYDPKIKEYFDDAIKTGRLVVDDGSIKFTVNGRQLNLNELFSKYTEYLSCADLEKRAELKPYHKEYRRLLVNQNNFWVHNDFNFEAMKAFSYARIHLRYNDRGEFDPSCMSQYEKLRAFYGLDAEKDEKPLRDDA